MSLLWSRLKVWRHVPIGPVALTYKFERRVLVTQGLPPAAAAPADRARPGAAVANRAPDSAKKDFAVIVGVGPGFGNALARALCLDGMDLVLISRNARRLAPLLEELNSGGNRVASIGCDVTDELAVKRTFEEIAVSFGTPALVVYSLQEFGPGQVLEITVPAFESAWRHNCLGAFLVAQAAGRLMCEAGRGTLILVGSTSALIGREGHLNLAVGKFGQRALSQVLARELWPRGVHVAHVVIDADIAEGDAVERDPPQADPAHIAQSIVAVHKQQRTAWSSELDLRPATEKFWQHC